MFNLQTAIIGALMLGIGYMISHYVNRGKVQTDSKPKQSVTIEQHLARIRQICKAVSDIMNPTFKAVLITSIIFLVYIHGANKAHNFEKQLEYLKGKTETFEAQRTEVKKTMAKYNCYNQEIENAIMKTFNPVLVAKLIEKESQFYPRAVSPCGALGLTQIMPYNLNGIQWDNPSENIARGAEFLEAKIRQHGSVRLALVAYNSGSGTVQKYGDKPPYLETQLYLRWFEREYGC